VKRTLFYFTLFILLSNPIFATTYHVNTEQGLEEVVPKLLPGDEIIIANGNYSNWTVQIGSKGTKARPIVIRAATKGGVVFNGETSETIFKITGTYITLSGITFKNCTLIKSANKTGVLVDMNNASNCAITKCVFKNNTAKIQYSPLIVISGNGSHNKVEDCLFDGNVDSQDLQVKITKDTAPQFTLITNNKFSNKIKVSWKNGNGGECIQIGQDPILLGNKEANTIVSNNKFYKCDGENEIISNKSSRNQYLRNYFSENDGELVMRGGHDCIVSGNTFAGGTGGIRINGTGHIVTNNKIDNIKTAIRLMYGMAKGKIDTGFYIAASNCTITNNKITNAVTGILVGDNKNEDWTGKFDTVRYPSPVMQNIAPFDNKIEGNTFKNVKATEVIQ